MQARLFAMTAIASPAPVAPAGAPPKVRAPRHKGVAFGVWLIAACAVAPVIALFIIALNSDGSDLPHLMRNVLPQSTLTTLYLLGLVALGAGVLGVLSAWMIAAYDFPFRRTLSWALVLPLAVPPYLAAYAFGEFFTYTGPVQTFWRELFGFQTIRDYYFPDVRSVGGVALVMVCVLYPYVYMTSRVVFLMQGRTLADAARTLGATRRGTFWQVLLPVARPAIVAGLALVLMETLNDIGAAEYFGVRTLTFSVYATWLGRGSLAGGAQVALGLLAVVLALLAMERWARRHQRFHNSRATSMNHHPPRVRLGAGKGILATLTLALPILFGFGIPLIVFGRYLSRRFEQLAEPALWEAAGTTVLTACITAVLTVTIALFLLNAARLSRSQNLGFATRLAAIGYALPGGVIGLGLLFTLTTLDGGIDLFSKAVFGISTGLLLTGTMWAVIIACTIRFIALAEGSIRSGLEKLPANIDDAARSLGRTAAQSGYHILLPLLRPAILTAAVMVFVDTVKELSATILLRPFGFNTLATLTYESASRGAPQEGAVAALLIIAVALAPIIILSRALSSDRAATVS